MKIEIKDLSELAELFEQNAAQARHTSNSGVITRTDRKLLLREAFVWTQAASILRQTELLP